MRLVLSLLLACAAIPLSFGQTSGSSDPPNIVFILVDDLGWTDVGAFGSTFYETPHIDRLAREGMVFTDAYAAAPICSPTRVSIMTGKYPARLHQTDWIPGRATRPDEMLQQVEDVDYLPLGEVTLPELLREAGYATGHFGKWHLGAEGRLPTDQGFDVNVAGTHRGYPPGYFHPYQRGEYQLSDLAATGQEGEHLTDRLGTDAVRFIEENKDQPFFLYLPFYAVHVPLEAKDAFVEKYRAKAERMGIQEEEVYGAEGEHRLRLVQSDPVYAGLIESVDENVGRVLEALEAHGVDDRTIIVFFSDNGGVSTSEGWPTSNLPLRAAKGWLYEGGIRVPMIVRWPGGTQPGSRTDEPVISTDFLPTLLDMAGLEERIPEGIDGLSLVPVLQREAELDREALYWHYPHYSNQGGTPSGAVREGLWKLIEFYENGRLELYHLGRDLGEQHNLADEQPEKAAALARRLATWREAVDAQMPRPNPDYVGEQ